MNCPKCNQPVAGLTTNWGNEKVTLGYYHVADRQKVCSVVVEAWEADERIRRERALIAEGA